MRVATTEAMLASVAALKRDDLVLFHRERYVGASLVLAVVGDVDAQAVAERVAAALAKLPKGARPSFDRPRTAPTTAVREMITMRGKASMNVVFGQASRLRRTDADYEAALIANAALGQSSLASRVGKRVRDEEGLSYNLSSRFGSTDILDGVWYLNVAVAPQNAARAIRSARAEIERYVRDGITTEEVAVQQSFFAGNYRVRLGNNAGIASALAIAEKFGYGPGYLDEFPERIRRVTREQVNAAIRAHLDPARMHLIVAGDLEQIPE